MSDYRDDSAAAGELIIVHTSDLHLGSEVHGNVGAGGSESLAPLRAVLAAAADAHLLLVAGDMFDNNRVRAHLLDAAATLLAGVETPIVILPGNHDPLTADSVYRRGPFDDAPNVTVLGLSAGESVFFHRWGMEVWGRAHRDYADMPPLADPPERATRWRIAMGHGHYEEPGALPTDHTWRPSWRFRAEDLAAADADYVALGHWERAAAVGEPPVRAYYSGSPTSAGTVNVVRVTFDGEVRVSRRVLEGLTSIDGSTDGRSRPG